MEKQIIKNRHGLKIVTQLERAEQPVGLALVLHGLGGFKEQAHIATFAKAFKESGYTVLCFDATNSFNESEGQFENASATKHYQDLEDVIVWAKKQGWYIEPFVLVGHSLGGIAVLLYTLNFPQEVKAVAPISTVVSGQLRLEAYKMFLGKEHLKDWQETGWYEYESFSKPGLIKRLPWSHMEDNLKYDILAKADKLELPVLLIVGEHDTSTPVTHQQMLYEKLPGPKELHIIKGAAHTFYDQEYLIEIKQIFKNWIEQI
jgi:pimeloyl-ACP methyl ester carboxylesterase